MNSFLLFRQDDSWSKACVEYLLSVWPRQLSGSINSSSTQLNYRSDADLLIYDSQLSRAQDSQLRLLSVWADDVADEAYVSSARSISEARKLLSQVHRPVQIWRNVPRGRVRRGVLLQAQLRSKKWDSPTGWASGERLKTLKSWAEIDRGGFMWLDAETILWSERQREIAPEGHWDFVEDRQNPPSRAYLKLWEWSWRCQVRPQVGERVLDLGASPGGWTWVLVEEGCRVVTLDKSPLDELDAKLRSRVESSHRGDAFDHESWPTGPWDWVTCDVIAAPERSLQLIEALRERDQRFVVTVKFRGMPTSQVLDLLARQLDDPRVKAQRLWHNKHEITVWMDRL